ncbi:hypothetical protein ACFRMO_07705 [Streptomyces anulatus]|uniref:hypothetical protein n=1 Tax=Streptomyces anulatus TaxID=1892 RepID=UPI0036804AFD
MSTHWTPPNRGKTSTSTGSLSAGQFPVMGDELHNVRWIRPQTGQTASRSGMSKSGGNETGSASAHRSQRLASTADTYGPTGVTRIKRALHGPGCPDCATTSRYRMPSAFGDQDNFRAGADTGKKG